MTAQHDAALAYAVRGWPVFPLRPRGKEPLTENGLHDATCDKTRIDEWWRSTPQANVALRTGDVFDVLDLDGPDAVTAFKQWCLDHSIDPATIRRAVSRTSKGWHYLFAASGIGNRARLLHAPIDWRGKGGYIVAPPSVHPSGRTYEWKVQPNGELPTVPAELRELLAPTAVLTLRPTLQRTTFDDDTDTHAAYLRAAFEGELERVRASQPGERNNVLFTALCNTIELVNTGLPVTAVDDICDAACARGLTQAEVDRTLTSAEQKAGNNVRELPTATHKPTHAVARSQTAPETTHPQSHVLPRDRGSEPLRPASDAFQGWIGHAVQQLDPWTEADPVGVLATLLAGAGCAIGRAPHARVSTTRHPLLIWPLLLGRTSSGRKGTAHDIAESLLQEAEPAFVSNNITGGLSSGEGLIHVVRDPTYEHSSDPDSEPKIIDAGVDDKRRWVVETEFGGTMSRAKREGSSLSAVMRQAWDGKTLATLTKTSVISSGAHIAITAHVTPREFLMRLRDSDLVGGTYNRFLPLLIHRSKLLPDAPSPPPELMQRLGFELRQRISAARKLSWVPRTEAASELWRDIYAELSNADDDDDRLGQFIARALPYVLRLSVLYALLDGKRHVDVAHVRAAAALVRYSIASVRAMLRSPIDAQVDRLREAIEDAGERGLTRTEVNGVFSGKLTAPELDELLERVPGLEVHRVATERGRPAQRYVIPSSAEKRTSSAEEVGKKSDED